MTLPGSVEVVVTGSIEIGLNTRPSAVHKTVASGEFGEPN